MKRALALLALAAALAGCAATEAPGCPRPADMQSAALHGRWLGEVEGEAATAVLQIGAHPDYAGSFAGTIERGAVRGQVTGDLEDGELTLEESADGQRIAATWLGDVVAGSCGRRIRGTWQATGAPAARGFVLRREGP